MSKKIGINNKSRKKIKIQSYTVSILILIITNIVYTVVIYNLKSNNKSIELKATNIISQMQSTINTLIRDLKLTYSNLSFEINPETLLISEENKELPLSEIKINDYIIVFRFNEFTCMDCVYKELSNINTLAGQIGNNRILILASYNNKRDLYLNKRINNIKHTVYNVPLKSLNNSIESLNIPYMFILDSTYRIRYLYIPNKYRPEISKLYFESVVDLMQNN